MNKDRLFNFILFTSLFVFFLISPSDPDLGWHLRCGEDLWQKGSWCVENQYSVLLAGYYWPNLYWLYQALLYYLFHFFSFWGLTIANGFLVALSFFFFYQSIKDFSLEKLLAIGVIIYLGWGVFSLGLRSQLLSFFFFNLLLWLNAGLEKNYQKAIWFIPVMFFWAQMHGSTILGLILIFSFVLPFILNIPKRLFWFAILVLSFLATLLNPFGGKIYEEGWRHFFGNRLDLLIAEWVPPNLFISGLIFFSWIILTLICFKKGKNQPGFWLFLALIPIAYFSLRAQRYLPFYFTLAFYVFFANYPLLKKLHFPALILFLPFFLLICSLFWRLPATISRNASFTNWCQNSPLVYPQEAVSFLRKQNIKGNIFNRYEWGGFLIWQLPEFKVFVDGRMPSWPTPSGKSPYTIYLETLQTQPGWEETLNQYQINWLFLSPGTFMDLKLRPSPEKYGWKEVYRDKTAVIYNRKI